MDSIHIQPGTIQPLVKKYFDRVSTVQWAMLAAGMWESSTQVLLADMCTEIVQTLSIDVLRRLAPVLKVQLLQASQQQLQHFVDKLSINLGDSIPMTFAAALNVPPQLCKNSMELSAFIGGEVLQKVNFALSAAVTANVARPVLYVSSTMWSFGSLYIMICHITKCLKRLLSNLEQSCPQCWQSEKRDVGQNQPPKDSNIEANRGEAASSVKYEINVSTTSAAVTDILLKLTSEDDESIPTHSLDAQVTATQIVDLITKDLHRVREGANSLPPHFNLSVIMDVVKHFVLTHDRRSFSQSDSKRRFMLFAGRQFERMTELLKVMIQSDDNNNVLVDLQRLRSSPLSGKTSSTIVIRAWTLSWQVIFDNICAQVENLFDKLSSPIKPSGDVCNILKSICDEIRIFSRELSHKLFTHMGDGQMAVLPQERRPLDSVISEAGRKMDDNGLSISAEYLYVMTEDVVGKFLQQLLLWLQVESSDKMGHAETITGALCNIGKYMVMIMSLPRSPSKNSNKSSESYNQQLRSQSIRRSNTPIPNLSGEEDASYVVRTHVDSRLISHRAALNPDTPACSVNVELPEELDSGGSTSSSKGLVSHFVGALIMELVTQLPWESRKLLLLNTIQLVTKHLSDYAIEHMRVTDPLKENYSLTKVVKVVIKDLLCQFNSLEELMETLMTQPDLFFYNHLVVCLKDHLGSLYTPRNKGRMGRFFSAISRAFANPPCV